MSAVRWEPVIVPCAVSPSGPAPVTVIDCTAAPLPVASTWKTPLSQVTLSWQTGGCGVAGTR